MSLRILKFKNIAGLLVSGPRRKHLRNMQNLINRQKNSKNKEKRSLKIILSLINNIQTRPVLLGKILQ
jgi:hypothetical protein